jgi:hypothetical protein
MHWWEGNKQPIVAKSSSASLRANILAASTRPLLDFASIDSAVWAGCSLDEGPLTRYECNLVVRSRQTYVVLRLKGHICVGIVLHGHLGGTTFSKFIDTTQAQLPSPNTFPLSHKFNA